MTFAPTWMELEIPILSEIRETKKSYDITYMWNLNKGTSELIYKTKTKTKNQIHRL